MIFLNNIFPISYPSDDLSMTCSDFVNALKMLISSEKHPVFRAIHAYTKNVVTDSWPTIRNFINRTIFLQILIYSTIFRP